MFRDEVRMAPEGALRRRKMFMDEVRACWYGYAVRQGDSRDS